MYQYNVKKKTPSVKQNINKKKKKVSNQVSNQNLNDDDNMTIQ